MTEMSNCRDAVEFVSALVDGETIPPDAAEHIGACPECKARLNEYLAMGAELRRVASVEMDAKVPALTVEKRRTNRSLWQRGWETMRIPKFAFALLVLAVVGLASSLTMVKVGAHSSGSVLMLNVGVSDGGHFKCPIDLNLKNPGPCTVVGLFNHAVSGFQFEVLARDGDRVQLGFRSKVAPMNLPGQHARMGPADVKNQPESQYWLEPGEPLKIDVDGLGTLSVNGEWMDHVPTMTTDTQLDAPAGELRMVGPMLLRDKQVVGDFAGGSTVAEDAAHAVMIYFPGTGRFLLSLAPMRGAVQGSVFVNRVTFKAEGADYAFVTGAPVSRAEKVWVLYEPDFKPQSGEEKGFIGSGDLAQIAPEAVPAAEASQR